MTGLVADDQRFDYADVATRVDLRGDNIADVADGEPCGVMVERLDSAGFDLAADYPADGANTDNCNMAETLSSRILNRGAVDLFSNVASDAKNIERVDFIFDHGVIAPIDPATLENAGHAVGEKNGNNPIQLAAILELDVFGQPLRFGSLVRINPIGCASPNLCYGQTDIEHEYAFLQNAPIAPQGFPVVTETSVERVSMVVASTAALGLSPGQRYYGFSLFANDVNASVHTLIDPATFPNDTDDGASTDGDDADIYGGLAGYFLGDSLDVVSGAAFLDTNDDGVLSESDAGISDINITLHADTNGNGVFDPDIDTPLHEPVSTNLDGQFQLPGLPAGSFFVVLDENDSDIPAGLALTPGSNPVPVIGASGDLGGVNFVFTGDSSGGTDTDGSDSGSDDELADDSGADDTGTIDDGSGGSTGDGVTAAVNDVLSVNQGDTLVAAVLLNDIDAVGEGLDIAFVSASPDASITITEDNTILYEANFGFFGTDTFMYTIEDANGTQSTAAVVVSVERFSDIDGDMLNDFEECADAGVDCENLGLQAGLDGSGVGSLSWLSLSAMLALLANFRMRYAAAKLSSHATSRLGRSLS